MKTSKNNAIVRPESKSLVFTMNKLTPAVKQRLSDNLMAPEDIKQSHLKKTPRYDRLIHKFDYKVIFLHEGQTYLITM